MRRAVIGMMLLVSTLTIAQTCEGAEWADRLFAESCDDFGKVPRGSKVRHEFALNNLLDVPITITKVHASCGCTTGHADASVVRPGRSTVIIAEMDTTKFVGKKSTVLYVELSAPGGREAEVQLGLTSHIVADILLSEGTVEFGAVAKGQEATQSISIERVGKPDWRIERMVTKCRAIDGAVEETVRDGKVVGYTLNLKLRPDAAVGMIRDEIRLITNDRETPSFTIQVLAQVQGALTASPRVLTLGSAVPGLGAEGRYLVRSTKPFVVKSVEGVGDGFVVKADNDSAKPVHVLTVSYQSDKPTTHGEIRKSFRVHTDLPGEPPLELNATLQADTSVRISRP